MIIRKASHLILFLLTFITFSLKAALPQVVGLNVTNPSNVQLSTQDLLTLTPAKYEELKGKKRGKKNSQY